jgi:hypothetical protein
MAGEPLAIASIIRHRTNRRRQPPSRRQLSASSALPCRRQPTFSGPRSGSPAAPAGSPGRPLWRRRLTIVRKLVAEGKVWALNGEARDDQGAAVPGRQGARGSPGARKSQPMRRRPCIYTVISAAHSAASGPASPLDAFRDTVLLQSARADDACLCRRQSRQVDARLEHPRTSEQQALPPGFRVWCERGSRPRWRPCSLFPPTDCCRCSRWALVAGWLAAVLLREYAQRFGPKLIRPGRTAVEARAGNEPGAVAAGGMHSRFTGLGRNARSILAGAMGLIRGTLIVSARCGVGDIYARDLGSGAGRGADRRSRTRRPPPPAPPPPPPPHARRPRGWFAVHGTVEHADGRGRVPLDYHGSGTFQTLAGSRDRRHRLPGWRTGRASILLPTWDSSSSARQLTTWGGKFRPSTGRDHEFHLRRDCGRSSPILSERSFGQFPPLVYGIIVLCPSPGISGQPRPSCLLLGPWRRCCSSL